MSTDQEQRNEAAYRRVMDAANSHEDVVDVLALMRQLGATPASP